MKNISAILLSFLLFTSGAASAGDQPAPLLTGKQAYGDWTQDHPGQRRLITADDLYAIHATPSVSNGPHVVSRPENATLAVPAGFTVAPFLTGLKDPRQMKMAPNGDIFLAESGGLAIRILRSADGATQAGSNTVFADHINSRPYGMAFFPPGDHPNYLYVALENKVIRYPYQTGDLKPSGQAQIIVPSLPEGHHWTRDIVFTPDGRKMLVAVGSGSNDGENGLDSETNRADILEFNPDGSGLRVYASGLRNPVTLAFMPQTDSLWTTVNERDGFGDNLPPDYVTHVKENGFYGWPFYYIGNHPDPRYAGQHPELQYKVITPDVLLQPHSAPLGLAFYRGKMFPAEYANNLFVALHGSWNRASRTGYKIIRIAFNQGKAEGGYEDFLTGFVTQDGNVWGRPVGIVVAKDGSLLFSDDAAGTVWRIAYGGK